MTQQMTQPTGATQHSSMTLTEARVCLGISRYTLMRLLNEENIPVTKGMVDRRIGTVPRAKIDELAQKIADDPTSTAVKPKKPNKKRSATTPPVAAPPAPRRRRSGASV